MLRKETSPEQDPVGPMRQMIPRAAAAAANAIHRAATCVPARRNDTVEHHARRPTGLLTRRNVPLQQPAPVPLRRECQRGEAARPARRRGDAARPARRRGEAARPTRAACSLACRRAATCVPARRSDTVEHYARRPTGFLTRQSVREPERD